MAQWQATFWLVPDIPERRDPTLAWLGERLPPGWREEARSVLPETRSWSPEELVWGRLDGHALEAWTRNGGVVSMIARVDLRDAAVERVLPHIGQFARFLRARFLTEQGLEVPATTFDLACAIERAPAFRYVSEPQSFLRRLRLAGASPV